MLKWLKKILSNESYLEAIGHLPGNLHTTGNNNSLLNPNTMKNLLKKLNTDLIVNLLIGCGLITLVVLFFASCTKTEIKTPGEKPAAFKLVSDDNLPEMVSDARGGNGKPKGPKPTTPDTTGNPPLNTAGGLIYVSRAQVWVPDNNNWNYSHHGDASGFLSPASEIPQAQFDLAMITAKNIYAKYNVRFTTDSVEYQMYPGKKIMCKITDTAWNRQLPSTGKAFMSSMQPGGGICWVFAGPLQMNGLWVGYLIAHETGHTAGLYHQEVYSPDCTHVTNYRPDAVMGVCYYSEYCRWVFGQTWACETWNDDDKWLTDFFGLM